MCDCAVFVYDGLCDDGCEGGQAVEAERVYELFDSGLHFGPPFPL